MGGILPFGPSFQICREDIVSEFLRITKLARDIAFVLSSHFVSAGGCPASWRPLDHENRFAIVDFLILQEN